MNRFQELKNSTSPQEKQILETLVETFDYFGIPHEDRESVGEALLRFRIFKDHDLSYNTDDEVLKKFLRMDEHFTKSLQKKRNK